MKLVSWNVDSFHAIMENGFLGVMQELNADIFSIQNLRLSAGERLQSLPQYHQYWNYAQQAGNAGTAIFAKQKPQMVIKGLGLAQFDNEGRTITLEYPEFFFVNVYSPFSGHHLVNLKQRQQWDQIFQAFIKALTATKPVIIGGDFNVAYQPSDIFDPTVNHQSANFTDTERRNFGDLLTEGLTDSFRYCHPYQPEAYTRWQCPADRQINHGTRVDYFLISHRLRANVQYARILDQIHGSNHCPIELGLAPSAS
ncbi:exodeoxyribonuclease III [uncultured Limosilactobacillus sp.]|uniref:exodeoxyribonuclease III n=1 Tax=uncultured Limosilactobacillus sp. TaxID=2837629 RepID=UPI0025F122C6|nr:exodeoxyribonuclease III [uncultured Limosilactobacillus sp.]